MAKSASGHNKANPVIWLAIRAGKMGQFVAARSFPRWFRKRNFLFGYLINPLLTNETKPVRSRELGICLVVSYVFTELVFMSFHITGKNEPGQYSAIFDLTLGQWRTCTSRSCQDQVFFERLSITFTCGLLLIISTHKLVVSRNFLSIRIVLSFFYLLIFYFAKLSTWIRRLPFAVFVRLLNLSVRAFRRLRRKQESLSSFLTFLETRKLSSPFSRIKVARTD